MNPTTYALCQKPVIGLFMWVTSLCSFPPLFSNQPISLSSADAKVSKVFVSPVERRYALDVSFVFESNEDLNNDKVVGDRYSDYCNPAMGYEPIPEHLQQGFGRVIPFKVVIRNSKSGSVVVDRIFNSQCSTGTADKVKTRNIAFIDLPVGEYSAEITNIQPQSGLEKVKATLSLNAGRFPK